MNKGLQIIALFFALGCTAAAETAERQPLKQSLPEYPAILKKLKIGGTVKLNALVAPDGTVKKTTIDGGNPVLAEVACNAVKKWKYAPASQETNVPVEITFDSQSAGVSVK
ncbi:MAG TPA: energy transducer TonB [Terriglobales bacterium]|jgi:TonB family protein|nr:energy transducer TonB [Terriglobales bacterium]